MNKSEKIRQAIEAGKAPKEIATSLKVPVSRVYTIKWQMKKKAPAVKKLLTNPRPRMFLKYDNPSTPMADFIQKELDNVEAQISRLQNIAAFLAVRHEQLKQNGE
jgi:hypothetical protein